MICCLLIYSTDLTFLFLCDLADFQVNVEHFFGVYIGQQQFPASYYCYYY